MILLSQTGQGGIRPGHTAVTDWTGRDQTWSHCCHRLDREGSDLVTLLPQIGQGGIRPGHTAVTDWTGKEQT